MDSEHPTERRTGEDRRQTVVDRRLWLDRRRGPGRRLSDERKSAEEGQLSDEQFEFLLAIDEYKRKNTRPFPTWTEVLEVIKALGYRKVAEPQPLAGFGRDAEPDHVHLPAQKQ
jgi:FMN phosphatase YigB (HAD superfamily)